MLRANILALLFAVPSVAHFWLVHTRPSGAGAAFGAGLAALNLWALPAFLLATALHERSTA
jgi:hypothetical protein